MNRLARFAGFGQHEEGHHAEQPDQDAVVERMQPEDLREPIIAALRTVHDPEIPVNIYDLGLIYTIDIQSNCDVDVAMTLTAPACPVAGMMPGLVRDVVADVEGVGEVKVDLVWDPPWNVDRMSDEAKLQLGML